MKRLNNRKLFQIFIILTAFLSSSICFFSGSVHSLTKSETISNYASQVVLKSTFNKKYLGIAIDAPNKDGAYYDNEFINLYGVFTQNQATFCSAINATKKYSINSSEFDSHNISLAFVGKTGTIKEEYNTKYLYRHARYNINTMFKDPVFNGTEFDKKHAPVIYLSTKQANEVLLKRIGAPKNNNGYSVEDYQSLIKSPVNIKINEIDYEYFVWNIFYDEGYYCSGLRDVLGEYVLTSYYQAGDLLNDHKCIYFLNQFEYQNSYFLKYINNRFTEEQPPISMLKNNLSGSVDEDFLLSFYLTSNSTRFDWVFTLCIVLSIVLVCVSICFATYTKMFLVKLKYISFGIMPLLVYSIFFVIFKISFNPIFFSNISCKANFFILLLFYFLYFLIPVLNLRIARRPKLSDKYNEITI